MSHGTTVLGTLFVASGGRVLECYSLTVLHYLFLTLLISVVLETHIKLRQSRLVLFQLLCVKSCIGCWFYLWSNYCYASQFKDSVWAVFTRWIL